MPRRIPAAIAALVLVAPGSACDSPVATPDAVGIALSIASGDQQTWAVGEELPHPLVVRVTRPDGAMHVGVPHQLVNFRVVSGSGSVFAGAAETDAHGYAREYWTLGPEVGENVLEVRAVDPSTGEKLVYARFVAYGVIRGSESCNGLDDDLDGTADDPGWRYCLAGAPAANTDGRNACTADHLDLNGLPADGCELLVSGRWTLTPHITLSCDLPGIPGSAELEALDVATTGDGRLAITPHMRVFDYLAVGGFATFFVAVPPGTSSFSVSGPFSFADGSSTFEPSGSGTAAIHGAFSTDGRLSVTVSVQMELSFTLLSTRVSTTCEVADVSSVATRSGS